MIPNSKYITGEDRERVSKICRHELGHFFVAQQLGFKTNDLNLVFQRFQGHKGAAGLEPNLPGILEITDIINYLESRIMILFAGVIAEAINSEGKYDNDYALHQWRNDGGVQDHAKIRELVFLLRGIKHPNTVDNEEIQAQLNEIDQNLIQRTGELILLNIELIHQVAGQMADRIKMYETPYTFSNAEIAEWLSQPIQ